MITTMMRNTTSRLIVTPITEAMDRESEQWRHERYTDNCKTALTLDQELDGDHVHAPLILRPDHILPRVSSVHPLHQQPAGVALGHGGVGLQLSPARWH